MNDYLKVYKAKILVLSPTFVGSGKDISKKEYRLSSEAQKVLIYDPIKFYQLMKKAGKAPQYENFLMNDNRTDLETWMRENRVGISSVDEAIRHSVSCGDRMEFGKSINQIMEFTKDPYGLPYVPGTSIKGMLRTILLGYEISKKPEKFRHQADQIRSYHAYKSSETNYRKESNGIEVSAFNTLNREKVKTGNAVNDNLQGLIISDSKPLKLDNLVLCQKIEYYTNNDEKSLNILRECLRPGTYIEFTITIDTQVCPYDADKIMEAIKVFNDMYYDCVLSKFNSKKRPADTIYLGGGAGFVSKTILYNLFGAKDGVEVTKNVFRNTLPSAVFESHGHKNDTRCGASPHILKCTRLNGRRFQMGMCQFIIEERKGV